MSCSIHAAALAVPIRLAAAEARKLGFDGILLDAVSPALDITTLSGTGRREFRHLLTTPRITLVGLNVDLGIKGFGPGAEVDRMLGRLDAIIESAVGIGAAMTCIDLGPLPTPAFTPPIKPNVNPADAGLILLPTTTPESPPEPSIPPPDPKFVRQVDDALLAVGAIADRYSAPIAFGSSLAGFAAVDRALATANCPWFGIDLDPVAMLRDRWPVSEIFSRMGKNIRHVRGRDAVLGSEGRTKPTVIARGDVKWRELLNALDGAGYGGGRVRGGSGGGGNGGGGNGGGGNGGWLSVDPIDLPDPRAAAIAGLKQLRAYGE